MCRSQPKARFKLLDSKWEERERGGKVGEEEVDGGVIGLKGGGLGGGKGLKENSLLRYVIKSLQV